MEEYNIYLQILANVGVPALISLIVAERLKRKSAKEISQFQTELNHLKSKENFKFTKLHEKRLEVLERTYYYITETSEVLKIYVSPLGYGQETVNALKDNFVKTFDEFTIYFKQNCIYFDEGIERDLQDFFKEALLIFATYGKNESAIDNLYSIKEVNAKLVPIKKQIEVKFRELLGN